MGQVGQTAIPSSERADERLQEKLSPLLVVTVLRAQINNKNIFSLVTTRHCIKYTVYN